MYPVDIITIAMNSTEVNCLLEYTNPPRTGNGQVKCLSLRRQTNRIKTVTSSYQSPTMQICVINIIAERMRLADKTSHFIVKIYK